MDLILPLGPGSRYDNIELRYALRSFEMYMPHDKVVIIGERPEWLTNIIHIPFKHVAGCHLRCQNIYNKIVAAFEISSEEIIFTNDDHFILKPIERMPYHHKGPMIISREDSYGRLQENTLNKFPGCNNFDTHCPIIYERSKFPVIKIPSHGIGIKTAYCVMNKIEGSFYPDCKISTPLNEVQIYSMLNERLYFSIGDLAFGGDILKVLQALYPEKSKYEN